MRTKPVLFLGYGARVSGWADRFLDGWDTPILTSWRGMDLVADDDPRFFGRPGSIASKYANLIVQNCDHLANVGARLDYPTTGYAPERFAPKAVKTKGELVFLAPDEWWEQCREWKAQYPLGPSWVDTISDFAQPEDVIVPSSSGMACDMFCQRFKVKKGQRVIFSPGLGSMGFALPQAVGAAFASGRRVVCVEGDGSLQLNAHALQTIRQHNLNIKLFILENNGYASIRNTQKRFGRFLGCDPSSGMTLPDTQRILDAYGVEATIIHIDPDTEIRPRLKSTIVDGKIIPGRLEDIE